jgi:hypothetical protein
MDDGREERFMKAYVVTTGSIFGLIVVAHVWRILEEGSHLMDLPYIALTVLSAALCLWSCRVLRLLPR